MSNIVNSVEQMTQGHLRNVQQLAVFYTGQDSVFAINIAKIKSFVITAEVDISDTPSDNDIVAGIATIRDEPVTLINLDKWLGYEALPIDQYQLILYCEFNHKQVGFLVKDMLDIVEKTTDQLRNSEEQNSKVTYTTYVDIEEKRTLCTVFNAEQLLVDIGWGVDDQNDIKKYITEQIVSDKIVLAAEDSSVARDIIHDVFKKAGIRYELYNDGKQLLQRFSELRPESIGMILTDIEMPEVDGFQVATFIKGNAQYSHIPVIINSSMTTNAVKGKMEAIGVDRFIGKTDIKGLFEAAKEYL
jgi:two-component system chemotaxis response regulator CheV